ncbi:hypothetical protein ACHAQA_004499 [Verticillium albo-atrum]
MASARFFAPLLLAASAAASIQVPLAAPKPQAFAFLAEELQSEAYASDVFVGSIPWYPYSMEVGVGTPAQTQSMVLSLSHGDSYVLYTELCFPSSNPNFTEYVRNCSSGAFNDEESSTFSYNSTDWYVSSYAGDRGDGVMMEDTVTVGGATLKNASLAISLATELDTGFFGLSTVVGYPGGFIDERRTSLLNQMVDQDVTTSPAFSIFAMDKDNATGSIIFDAVDKSQYEGSLQRIQASAGRDKFTKEEFNDKTTYTPGYFANVSAVWRTDPDSDKSVQYVNSSQGGTFYAAIDPTFSLTNLPDYVTNPIYEAVGGIYIRYDIGGFRTVLCNRTDSIEGSFSLELGGEGGYRLSANMRDLIVPPEEWHVMRAAEDGSEPTQHCLFGIQSIMLSTRNFKYDGNWGATNWIIGNMVLKKTYMVFDGANMEVSLAPLRSKAGSKTDVRSFESASAHAPDSEFVGFEECFGDDCETEEDEPDVGPHVVVHRGVIIGSVLGALGFIMLS